jgi:hypothetical protein
MMAGHRTAAIYRLVARAHADELRKLTAAKKARVDPEQYPPLVWATDATPVSNRTVDAYIAAAKERFEREGREMSKDTSTQFGVIMSRLNDLYARALKQEKWTVCERLIRLHADIFGIPGSIKPAWIDPGNDGAPGDASTPKETPEVSATEDAAERELRELFDVAIRRAGHDPASITWLGGNGAKGKAKGNGKN